MESFLVMLTWGTRRITAKLVRVSQRIPMLLVSTLMIPSLSWWSHGNVGTHQERRSIAQGVATWSPLFGPMFTSDE